MTTTAIYLKAAPYTHQRQLRAQLEYCLAFIDERGWEFDDIIVNDPERLRDVIRTGRVGRVVAMHVDRFARRPRDMEEFIHLVEEHGVEIATVQWPPYDLNAPAGRILARVIAAAEASDEQRPHRERVKRSLQARRDDES